MTRYAPQLITERIYVETSEYIVVGTITLPEVQRVSDALNNRDRDFIALTDAISVSKADGCEAGHSFLALGRRHIVMAFSLSDPQGFDHELTGPTGRSRSRAIEARLSEDHQLVAG